MPAVITHDMFARDVLRDLPDIVDDTRGEYAFLLGSQGPDPLFFLTAHPRKRKQSSIGRIMHKEKPTELLGALKRALSIFDGDEADIARAYCLGFICHYLLDSTVHPLVNAKVFEICDAEIDGLSRVNAGDVHADMECELDEMALWAKQGCTIADYKPSQRILRADHELLDVCAKIHTYLALTVYGHIIDLNAFPAGVRAYRTALAAMYSPRGFKRKALAAIEQTFRPYSRASAMSHANTQRTTSWYANDEHARWENPFTGSVSTTSFWDLYDGARFRAAEVIDAFDAPGFDEHDAQLITHDINFSGEPTSAILIANT